MRSKYTEVECIPIVEQFPFLKRLTVRLNMIMMCDNDNDNDHGDQSEG